MPARFIEKAPQVAAVALRLEDDELQGLPEVIGLVQDFDHQGTAHAADDGAVRFPCFNAGQAVTEAAVDTVRKAGTGHMSLGRRQRSRHDIGGNG